MRALRALRAPAAAVAAAGLLTLGLGVPAGGQSGNLPGGTPIAVTISTPTDGAAVPYGQGVPITGTAHIDGTATTPPNTVLVYDIDVSGSTTSGSTQPACGNANPASDGLVGTTLDCEIAALRNLNQQAKASQTVAQVGVVALGGHGGTTNGSGDSRIGDVGPASGPQQLTAPATDANANSTEDVEEVLASADADSGAAFWGLRRFDPVSATSGNTNYQESVLQARTLANASTAANKLVVMVSDGAATIGNNGLGSGANGFFDSEADFKTWVQSVAGGVKFVAFGVGANGTCDGNTAWVPYGTLDAIVEATGGTCREIPNPADAKDVVPQVVNAMLTGLTVTVDGHPIAATATPMPPVTGPADLTWSAMATGLSPGSHTICATAAGKDAGGTGSVQECRTIDVQAVTLGDGPFGGGAADTEGRAVPISADLAPGASFAGWSIAPQPASVDPGATCTFADANAADTTVTCTDDGVYDLTATTLPTDSASTTLTLGNADPVLNVPAIDPTGTVFTGSDVTVAAPFSDAGENDVHTCSVVWNDGTTTTGTITEPVGATPGACTAHRILTDAGTYSATMTVVDDDLGDDTESTPTGADLRVVDLTIVGGDPSDGTFHGTEGTAVLPTVDAPAGSTLGWGLVPPSVQPDGVSCTLTGQATATPSLLCDDDADLTLSVTATLPNASTATATIPVHVENADPVLTTPTLDHTGAVIPGTIVTVSGTFTDAGANDTHTCTVRWSDRSTDDLGTLSAGTCSAQRTLTAPGSYTASMTVVDDNGGTDTASTSDAGGGAITVTELEIPAGPGAGGSYVGTEGSAVPVTVTGVPAGATLVWTATRGAGTDTGAACSVADGTTDHPSFTCNDDGTFTLQVTATLSGYSVSASRDLVVANAAPDAATPSLTATLVPVGTDVGVTGALTDAGSNDTHTCTVTWDDGAVPTGGNVTGHSCSASRTFTAPGVYSVTTTITDDDGASDAATYQYLVVYDPAAGFVTGGGTINVPAGSMPSNPSAGGRANFGFSSKYKKGASTPDGSTEFQFQAGNLNFHSDRADWLVVSGSKAQYKGTGTINGVPGYSFLVTARDGSPDQFRIKITETSSGSTVFDNVMGATSDFNSAPATAISGGSIVIHAAK